MVVSPMTVRRATEVILGAVARARGATPHGT
jgi:hypothetical protein